MGFGSCIPQQILKILPHNVVCINQLSLSIAERVLHHRCKP